MVLVDLSGFIAKAGFAQTYMQRILCHYQRVPLVIIIFPSVIPAFPTSCLPGYGRGRPNPTSEAPSASRLRQTFRTISISLVNKGKQPIALRNNMKKFPQKTPASFSWGRR